MFSEGTSVDSKATSESPESTTNKFAHLQAEFSDSEDEEEAIKRLIKQVPAHTSMIMDELYKLCCEYYTLILHSLTDSHKKSIVGSQLVPFTISSH